MNTIGVYTQTTTAAGYKADLVKAFAKGVGQIANDNWRAELLNESKVKNGSLTYFVLIIKEHILKKQPELVYI